MWIYFVLRLIYERLKLSKLLDEAEKKWIKKYDCTTKSGKGYNVQDGGKIMPPKQFLLEERWYEIYKEDGWGEVQNPSSYGTAKGVANIVNFTPVRTKAPQARNRTAREALLWRLRVECEVNKTSINNR